jgi:Ca2+-binding RTX toxin-like protein
VRIRSIFVSTLAVMTAFLGASPAWGAATCTYDGSTASVVLDADGDAATISAPAGTITVNGSACGSATTANTDLITVRESVTDALGSVTIDLGPGPFAPGVTDEPGSSDEIEFDIDLAGGSSDTVGVLGTTAMDSLVAGTNGINLNAAETDGVDADATLAGVEQLSLGGREMNDTLSSAGGSGTGTGAIVPATLAGGSGAEVFGSGPLADHVEGGTGFDRIDYSARTLPVNVSIGDGFANDGQALEGDEVMGDIEWVLGGAGNDVISGDGNAERFESFGGDDHLMGAGGDDELRAGEGNDLLQGGPNDDFLNGGPGNDDERGEGFNDVFVPNTQDHFGSFASMPIVDKGTTTQSITISGAQKTIYDTNMRLDIEHPAPQHLKITLIAPSGRRNTLIANRGNGTPLQGTYFDSEALVNIRNAGGRPFEGRFHPDGSMEIFDSQNPNGTWTLEIVDSTSGSVGTLNWWNIQFTLANQTADGNDLMTGGGGDRDLIEWFGRVNPIHATMAGGADDGQAGEADNVGNDLGDIEDVYGGQNADTIYGTDARNEIRGMIGNDQIFALGGVDTIRGRQGSDTINGGDANDTINGGLHADTIDGGAGVDFTAYTGAPSAMTVDLSTGTTSGGDGSDSLTNIENVTGTGRNDTIIGNGLQNLLDGGAGDDTLRGGSGNDTLFGAAGADTLDGELGSDWAKYQGAPSSVTVDLAAGTATGGHGSDTLTSMEYIVGSNFGDSLSGASGPNLVNAGGGDDSIFGLSGKDKLDGQAGTDTADGGTEVDACPNVENKTNCES